MLRSLNNVEGKMSFSNIVFDIMNSVLKKGSQKSKRNMLLRHSRFPYLYLLKMLWLHNGEKSMKSYWTTSSSSQILELHMSVCVYIYIYIHTHTHLFNMYMCVCVCVYIYIFHTWTFKNYFMMTSKVHMTIKIAFL